MGGVFRDEAGSYAGRFVRKISPALNHTTVELLAVREGVRWVADRNLARVIVESD